MSHLGFFCRFYQIRETWQTVDLSKSKDQYLLPINHPVAEKIQRAAKDLNENKTTKLTAIAQGLYSFDATSEWLIRGTRMSKRYCIIQNVSSSPSSNILRVVMNHRLKEKIKDKKLDVIIPTEYLVDAPNPDRKKSSNVNYEDFFVASEKLDILTTNDAIKQVKSFPPKKQKEIANTICRLIYHSGFMDAHMANIVLTRDNHLAIIDTEGHGLLHDITEKTCSPIPLCDARIVGLKEFISRSAESRLPDIFTQTAKKYLFFARVMKVVKNVTIFFSIICPLIPLVVLVCSVISAKRHSTFYSSPRLSNQLLPSQTPVLMV